jgi:cytochrome c oxidase subunit 2
MNTSRRDFCLRIPFACAAVLVMPAGCTRHGNEPQTSEQIISIEAKRFSFTPNRITLKRGVAVVLEITALDFAHGFNIPDMNIRTDLIPGKAVRVALKPEQAGEFTFLCDNFCGSGHEQMEGKISVTA